MRCLLFLPLLAFAAPVTAEVTAVSDSGFVINQVVDTPATKSDAWKTLIAPAQWWSSAHTYSGDAANLYLDAQATGCFCEKLPRPSDAPESQRMGSVEHMHVIQSDPRRGLLRMVGSLGPLQSEALVATLTITLKPGDAGTRIEWSYVVGGQMRMKPQDMAPLVDQMLGEQIGRLAARLTPPATEPAPAPQ